MFITDEEIAREDAFLKGLPFLNIGALILPPVWGPAHGIWLTILYYPLWLIADNCFYGAYSTGEDWAIALAVVVGIVLLVTTVVFARLSQPFAAHRAADRGTPRETYLKNERIWAIVSIVVGAIMIAAATYYNICIRPEL